MDTARASSDLTEPAPEFRPIPRVPLGERTVAFLVALGTLTVLILAARLTPDPAGHGTHEQLGLPPCAFLAATGHPCPTCGMTTAFSHTAHLHLAAAFRTNPFGALLALGTAVAFWASLHVALLGSRIGRVCGRLLRPGVLWVLAGLWLLSWVYTLST
jgi:hypothetical protein